MGVDRRGCRGRCRRGYHFHGSGTPCPCRGILASRVCSEARRGDHGRESLCRHGFDPGRVVQRAVELPGRPRGNRNESEGATITRATIPSQATIPPGWRPGAPRSRPCRFDRLSISPGLRPLRNESWCPGRSSAGIEYGRGAGSGILITLPMELGRRRTNELSRGSMRHHAI